MPRRTARIVAGTIAVLLAGPAGATATLTCSAEDRNLSFELMGNIGSGPGAAVQATKGEIKLKAVRGMFDAMEFKVEPGQVAGNWTFGKELRIGIAPDNVNDVSAYLAIIAEMTKGKNDGMTQWRGFYALRLHGPKGPREIKGKLKGCDAG